MRKLFILTILSITLVLAGCSGSQNNSNSQAQQSSSTVSQTTQKVFTLTELQKYDGQNGNPAYVAVDGIVYDVSNVKAWAGGQHYGGITAGKDLSKEILKSPHGKGVLKNLPIVGKLK